MSNLTEAQRNSLENSLRPLEAAQSKLNALQKKTANYFKEGKSSLKRADEGLQKLWKIYELADAKHRAILMRAKTTITAEKVFATACQVLSIGFGYPGNSFELAIVSMSLSSLNESLQGPAVPQPLSINTLPSGQVSSSEVKKLFSDKNPLDALEGAAQGKALYAMASDLLVVGDVASDLGLLSASLSQTYMQVNQAREGRLGSTTSVDAVIKAASRSSQTKVGQTIDSLAKEVDKCKALLAALKSAADAIEQKAKLTTFVEMEKWIWIIWIANLRRGAWSGSGFAPQTVIKRTADVLDNDVIEDHLEALHVLGPKSRLNVDFGGWTSDEDENKAVVAAYRLVYPGRALPPSGRIWNSAS